jgi:hypothetical protein
MGFFVPPLIKGVRGIIYVKKERRIAVPLLVELCRLKFDGLGNDQCLTNLPGD